MASIPAGFRALPSSLRQLSLAAVLKCGQSFRWTCHKLEDNLSDAESATHEYRLTLPDRVIAIRQSNSFIFYRAFFPLHVTDVSDIQESETLAFIHDYFQLEVDLVELYDNWSARDEIFRNNVRDRFQGIRILRQDPWENLVSFICSQNNHIPRISKMVQSLCTEFSPPLLSLQDPSSPTMITYHPFPAPHLLAPPSTSQKLRDLGFGYRAEYIQKTAQMLCSSSSQVDPQEWLLGLRKLDVDAARTELLKFCGVGPKVADCVLLMSLDKKNVVPVDTHVYQIAIKHYNMRSPAGKAVMSPKIYEAVGKRFVDIWGDYAGWAHSVLFTADLKSFKNYGLESPDVTPEGSPSKIASPASQTTPTKGTIEIGVSDSLTPVPLPRKRKNQSEPAISKKIRGSTSMESQMEVGQEFTSMAERVKSRSRVRSSLSRSQ